MSTQLNPFFVRSAGNSANRDTARDISLQVIAKVMPNQVGSSAFAVEPLLDHAARGQLVRAGSDPAFGVGSSDLLILVVIPIVVSLLTEAFKTTGVAGVRALLRQPFSPPVVTEAEVRRILDLTRARIDKRQIPALTAAINATIRGRLNVHGLPTIGIVTALPREYAAVKAILEQPQEITIAGAGSGRRYLLGQIPTLHGGAHHVALSLAEIGNNIAAIRATLLLEHFPNVGSLLMVGIAGGVPHPQNAAEHVRLGDIVVSDARGVVQYDFAKKEIAEIRHRQPPRPPSATLLEAIGLLEVIQIEGRYPWVDHIQHVQRKLTIQRPEPATDLLLNPLDPSQTLVHPQDPKRNRPDMPRVFKGPIASANTLLKNPHTRDLLRDTFGVKAVEMEGSGIADATWNHEVGYLVVRGICDYCDSNKDDTWQAYASIAAAGYSRALIESMPIQQPVA